MASTPGFNDGSATRTETFAAVSPDVIKGKLGDVDGILSEGQRQKTAAEQKAERDEKIAKEKKENVWHYSKKLSSIAKNLSDEIDRKLDAFIKDAKKKRSKPAVAQLEWSILEPVFTLPNYKMPTSSQVEESLGFGEVRSALAKLNGLTGRNMVADIRDKDLKGFILRIDVSA